MFPNIFWAIKSGENSQDAVTNLLQNYQKFRMPNISRISCFARGHLDFFPDYLGTPIPYQDTAEIEKRSQGRWGKKENRNDQRTKCQISIS